jgi:hypothetical protein
LTTAPPDKVLTEPIWSRDVVEGVGSHGPIRQYVVRPSSLPQVLDAAVLRWSDREHIVQGDQRVTFVEHRRAVDRAAGRGAK